MGVVERKVIVRESDGYVVNVCLVDPDVAWEIPSGCIVVDDVYPAQPGATWDGSKFTLPDPYVPTRLEVLMDEGPLTQTYNSETRVFSDRPAEDIAADKTELLGLLQAKLSDTGDLTWKEMNKMLALERES